MKPQTLLLVATLVASCSTQTLFAGYYRTITVDGETSDWTGISPAYENENGVNNPSGVDFQAVYLANDDTYLYIRYTLQASADPISAWNTYIWLDHDANNATGFHPFGNPNFGSSVMIINDQAYQQAEGGWNEGTLATAGVSYGANAIPGSEFEFRILRSVTGVSGAFNGVGLLNTTTIGVELASETGTGDSLPAWSNYGTLLYTFQNPPVANAVVTSVVQGGTVAIPFDLGKYKLGTDVDGDSLTITAVGDPNAADYGVAGTDGASISYTNLAGAIGAADVFSFIVSDGNGGLATNTVSVFIGSAQGANHLAPPVVISPGTVALSYLGIPGESYALDHATNLTPPVVWTPVSTNQAAINGRLDLTNSSAAPENYFRTRHVIP